MPTEMRLDGLDEFSDELKRLPDDLSDEGGAIAVRRAEAAEAAIAAKYPRRTGDLASHTRVQVERSGHKTEATVINDHRLAWIFELGTQARHTSIGANRGAMPAGHVFLPITQRAQREKEDEIAAMLREKGLTVAVIG